MKYTVEYGAIPVTEIRKVFQFYDPNAVSKWVEELEGRLREQRPLTIDIFLKALESLKGKAPDVLPAGVIAYECRQSLQAVSVKEDDVIAVARGLSILTGSFSFRRGVAYGGGKEPKGFVPHGVLRARHAP